MLWINSGLSNIEMDMPKFASKIGQKGLDYQRRIWTYSTSHGIFWKRKVIKPLMTKIKRKDLFIKDQISIGMDVRTTRQAQLKIDRYLCTENT